MILNKYTLYLRPVRSTPTEIPQSSGLFVETSQIVKVAQNEGAE